MPTIPARTWPALLLLGFASGLPNALVDSTLQTWLQEVGWSKSDLIWAGYATLPYLCKVLWAPVVDRLVPPWLGRRRGWLLATQVAVVVALVAMACSGASAGLHPGWLLAAATLASFASATQDLVVNGYTIDALPAERLPTGVGLSVWGYRAAMVVSGGLALVAAGAWGWQVAYLLMAALLLPGMVGTWLAPEPERVVAPTTWRDAVVAPLADFHRRLGLGGLGLLLGLVLLYRLSDGLAGMLAPAFLRAMHYDLIQLGMTRSLVGLASAGLGVVVAAWSCGRLGLLPSLWLFGLAQAFSNLGYVGIEQGWWVGLPGLIGVLVVDTACGAAAGTVFVAWLMGFCTPALSATQYALLTAVTVLGPHLLRPVIAPWADALGWSGFFLLTIVAVVPGCILLVFAGRLQRRTA